MQLKSKKIANIFRATVFLFLMFTTFKISIMDEAELGSGKISILGVEIEMVSNIKATTKPTSWGLREKACFEQFECGAAKWPDYCNKIVYYSEGEMYEWDCWRFDV